jgi:hypothetical protein
LAIALTVGGALTGHAATLSFQVNVNTASLIGNPNAPYSLDFQLNQGTGAATNTVALSHFVFTAGNPTGSPTRIGGVTGDLTSSVFLTDATNPANEFFQGISGGTTRIAFDVSMTDNVDPTTPDAFVMAILDKSLGNIPTTGLGDSLLLVNIDVSNLSLANVQTFTSTSPDAGVTVTVTPEPGTLGMVVAVGLIALGRRVRRKSGATGCVAAALIAICSASGAFAQTPIFAPGDVLVSRSTYLGTIGTVAFPGLLPNNAASVANGSFPNVFNNETPDASFGVTSPVYVDRMNRTGGIINTIPVTSLMFSQHGLNVATSFPSKSELGLSLTPAGDGVTFMAYGAPINSLDVSNSNTPGHVDITNPVNGQGILVFQRDIIELDASGASLVTTTNTYSGNNGRNALLGSNGNYYMVGNAGNNGKSMTLKAGTVTLTGNTVSLSGGSNAANIYVGTPFSGANVPIGAYVTGITDSTHFTISPAATGTASGAYTANAGAVQLTGVSFSPGSATITVDDTSKLVPGMPLSGAGFATGSYIQSITNGTHFIASAAPTGISSNSVSYTAAVSNSMLSDDTGVQMIQKGLNDTTGTGTGILDAVTHSTVVGKVNSVYGSATGYQRGFSMEQIGLPADKTGKDDNFRGLTNYKDTLYVTKGSGGNGLDAVYQVNPASGSYVAAGVGAGLPTAGNAAVASINPLPGWPLNSTGANEGATDGSIVHHPFGIWFANDTTLYVADEGLAGASASNAAPGGLEKWIYNGSQWQLKYTLAAGAIPSYTVSGIGPLQALGLRNISGVNNGDGTVTIYGITSTAGQTLNDEGADPNQLVSITDNFAATTLPSESYTVLETAAYGDVLRGVAVIPGVAITSSGFVRDRRTGFYTQQITIRNETSAPLAGPVNLVLDNLSANATLSNKNGVVGNNPPLGSPYIVVPGTAGGLAVGASASVVLQFSNSNNGNITYNTRLFYAVTP